MILPLLINMVLWSALRTPAAQKPYFADTAQACFIAEAVVIRAVKLNANRRMVFKAESEDLGAIRRGMAWRDDEKPTPPPKLLKDLLATKGVSALAVCANVRKRLRNLHIAYGDHAVESAISRRSPHLSNVTIMGVSLPVIGASGEEALVAISRSGGPLEGAGSVQLLRRDAKGAWLPVSSMGLWVS